MQSIGEKFRVESKALGFVPTMGALHKGHLSLVKRSKNENDATVVSIYVNPVQFGPKEDFNQYPRDIEGDLNKLSASKVDIVFIPADNEMYPEGFSASVHAGHAGKILCGAIRPGHFDGVTTVVTKFFNIVMPARAYFGQKDFQQAVIIKKIAGELDFDMDVIVCPTIREDDGLAMSSRNSYLNPQERKAAPVLYKALKYGKNLINKGMADTARIKKEVETFIKSEPLAEIDYVEIVDHDNLDRMKTLNPTAVICLAVRIGSTRLIDNLII